MLDPINQSEFYEIDDRIYFIGSDVSALISYLKKSNCKKLFIRFDVKINNLDFLYELDFLESLSIQELHKDISIEPIYSLKNLIALEWYDVKHKLEVNRFYCLEELSFAYSENIILEENKKLKKVYIGKIDNFSKIPLMPSVKELKILGYKGTDLEFINKCFPNLIGFTLVFAKKLKSLEFLESLNLKLLELERINKNCDLSNLRNCQNMEQLYLRDRIENCNFIKDMTNLKIFFCKEIMDGNLEPIFNSSLEDVYIVKIPKNSTHTKIDIKEKFGEW